jgi:hypothetical protein
MIVALFTHTITMVDIVLGVFVVSVFGTGTYFPILFLTALDKRILQFEARFPVQTYY